MKTKVIIGILALSALAYCAFVPSTKTCTCTHVIDGDTYDLDCSGSKYRVRLSYIDCPELKQAYGEEARTFAENHIGSSSNPVEFKPDGKDKYGRHLGEIFVKDVSLNLHLVKSGYAWTFGLAPRWYREAATIAVREKKGLWADPNAKNPYYFRMENRNK